MTQHKDLTGDDLHEPKGITTATKGLVYVANGTNSGSWKKIGVGEIDPTGITGLTRRSQSVTHPSIRTNLKSVYTAVEVPGTLVKISGILDASPTEEITLTFLKNGTGSIGAVTIAGSSPEGSQFASNINPSVSFVAGDYVKIVATGGTAGTTLVSANIQLVFNY